MRWAAPAGTAPTAGRSHRQRRSHQDGDHHRIVPRPSGGRARSGPLTAGDRAVLAARPHATVILLDYSAAMIAKTNNVCQGDVTPMTEPSDHATSDRLKVAMTAAWDRGAADYDHHWGHGLQTAVEREAWVEMLKRLVPPTPALRILDVGTGTGFLALLLGEIGHQVVGIDLSEGMLSVARAGAQQRGLDTTFVVGDVESPPEDLGRFDVVMARHVFWTLLQPEAAVRAWADLLRPQGRVIVIDVLMKPAGITDGVLHEAGRILTRLRPGSHHADHSYPAEVRGRLPLRYLASPEPARNVLVRAGLIDVLSEELTWIDDLERSVMPIVQRLQHRSRRYLVEGRIS